MYRAARNAPAMPSTAPAPVTRTPRVREGCRQVPPPPPPPPRGVGNGGSGCPGGLAISHSVVQCPTAATAPVGYRHRCALSGAACLRCYRLGLRPILPCVLRCAATLPGATLHMIICHPARVGGTIPAMARRAAGTTARGLDL